MSERIYRDVEGNVCSLDVLCMREPAWAANRIRFMGQELAEARATIAQVREWLRNECTAHPDGRVIARWNGHDFKELHEILREEKADG